MADLQTPAACLRTADGEFLDLPGQRWLDRVDAADEFILSWAEGPVIDLGCGPGRHVEALAEKGIAVLGIDISPPALAEARGKKLLVLNRSMFEEVPRSGSWQTALLLDGNIGIGGDPAHLLHQTHSVLKPGGLALVEIHTKRRLKSVTSVCLDIDGVRGPSFDWIEVDEETLAPLATAAGFTIEEIVGFDDRLFAILRSL